MIKKYFKKFTILIDNTNEMFDDVMNKIPMKNNFTTFQQAKYYFIKVFHFTNVMLYFGLFLGFLYSFSTYTISSKFKLQLNINYSLITTFVALLIMVMFFAYLRKSRINKYSFIFWTIIALASIGYSYYLGVKDPWSVPYIYFGGYVVFMIVYIMPWYFNAYFGFLKYQILMPFKLLGMIGEGARMEFTKTKVLVDEWSEKNKNVK